jgi:hypothetical protein
MQHNQNKLPVGVDAEDLDVRGRQNPVLLLMLVLACIFMQSVVIVVLGGDYDHGPYNGDDFPFQSESEQGAWRAEIYQFLNCDNCDGCGPAQMSSQPGITAGNIAQNKTAGNNTSNYWLLNANKFYLAGSYDQAIASYSRALALNSSLTEGRINMANSLYFLGRYQESLDAFNAVMASDPQNANAILGKSKAMMAINRTRSQ